MKYASFKHLCLTTTGAAALLLGVTASAQTVLLNHYNVTYDGRTYDALGDLTAFSYTVRGTGEDPELSHFTVGLPDDVIVVGADPEAPVELGVDPTTGVDGIKWDTPLGTEEEQTYTVILEGNVGEGEVDVAVKGGPGFEIGTLPGPGDGTVACVIEPEVMRLLAGQHMEVGAVSVWNDAETLFVQYALVEPGTLMTETHLAVSDSLDGIPTSRNGNPKIGLFPYTTEHNPGVIEFTYEVPLGEWLVGTQLFLAAHAVVVGDETAILEAETAWAEGDKLGRSWAMYFDYEVQGCP